MTTFVVNTEPWMATLKIGDAVRRKPEKRTGAWTWGDDLVAVSEISDDGMLRLADCGDAWWQHYNFYPVHRP